MKNNKSMLFEIILVVVASLVTLGISVKSIIDKRDEEFKTKQFQDKITELTRENLRLGIENGKKTDSIEALSEKISKQAELIQREQNNPIPKKGRLSVFSTINMPENELIEIASKLERVNGFNKMLHSENISFLENKKLAQIANGGVRIWLEFENGDKNLKIIKNLPVQHISASPMDGSSFLSFNSDSGSIRLSLFTIELLENDISSNSASLNDFQNCELKVIVQFSEMQDLAPHFVGFGRVIIPAEDLNVNHIRLEFSDGRNNYTIDNLQNGEYLNHFVAPFQFKLA